MTTSEARVHLLSRRRGSYGIDAPYVPALLLGAAAISVLGAVLRWGTWWFWLAPVAMFAGSALLYLHTTLRGKFIVWDRIVESLDLRGDEQVLDVGCGRGMVLNTVAAALSSGTATGVDIWSAHDQSGNAMEATLRNAELEGVADRVRVETADMRELPFEDATFDLVVSNAAFHNLSEEADRRRAIGEAWRVTRPGGRLVLADIRNTTQYAEILESLGARGLTRRSAGWLGWFGNAFVATTVVRASR